MDNDRPMFQGSWECSGCGKAITELPFEPKSTSNLLCRDCHRTKRDEEGGGGQRRERKMFSGDWKCADCGSAITELPFEPRETNNLRCRNCFRNR